MQKIQTNKQNQQANKQEKHRCMVYSLFIRMSKKNALVETKRESERNYLLSREIPLQSSSFLDGPSYIYCERERKNRVENGFLIQMFFFSEAQSPIA